MSLNNKYVMVKESLKIGIVLNSMVVPLWVNRLLKKIIEDENLDLKLILSNKEFSNKQFKKPLLYRIHEGLEKIVFRNFTNFNKTTDISDLIRNIDEVSFSNDLIESKEVILAYQLDVIINMSSCKEQNTGIRLAKFGVWTYYVENQNPVNTNSGIYWKVVKRYPVLKAIVKCKDEKSESSSVIHTSWLATNYNSIFLSQNPTLVLGSVIIHRLLKGIHSYGNKYFNDIKSNYNEEPKGENIAYVVLPTNSKAIANLFNIVTRYIFYKLTNRSKTKWFLMFKLKSTPLPQAINGYKYLLPPIGKFWADPFVLCKNNKNYLFIEELPFKTNKGHITLLEVDKSGILLKSEKIIEQSYHMSYPFVFEYDNNYYMIPETSRNETIELYRCVEFPAKWTFVMKLMEHVDAKDTTMYYYNNKWWMFTAINESNGYSDHLELFLFYADDLLSNKWISHPLNPIVTDIRNARPAGKIFNHGKKIYRPSQDCSERYGKAININQIVDLSETSFREIPVSKLEASWSPKLKGTHTFNFDDNFTVIDVY